MQNAEKEKYVRIFNGYLKEQNKNVSILVDNVVKHNAIFYRNYIHFINMSCIMFGWHYEKIQNEINTNISGSAMYNQRRNQIG